MKLINLQTGETEVVADPSSAILNQTHAPTKSETFRYINPEDNGIYETTGAELYDRLSKGAILETPEMRRDSELKDKYGNAPITTALEGAARSLSFGGYDAAVRAIGGEQAVEAVKARKELNPISAITGEVGGIVLPTLLSGGTSLIGNLAKGSTALTRGVASASENIAAKVVKNQLGKAVVGSALEGAAYGTGQTISEAALGEPTNLAENLLIGGAFGAGIPISGVLAKKAAKTAANLTTDQQSVKTFSQFLKNTDDGFLSRELASGGVNKLDEVKNKAIQLFDDSNMLASKASDFFKQTKFAKANELLKNVDLYQAIYASLDLEKKLLDTTIAFKQRPSMYSGPGVGKLEDIGNDLRTQLMKANTSSDVFKILDETKSLIQGAVSKSGTATAAEQEAFKALRGLADDFKTTLENSAVWGEAGVLQQKLNSAYSSFIESQKAFKQNFMKKFGSNYVVDPKKIENFIKAPSEASNSLKAEAFQRYFDDANNLRQQLAAVGAPVSDDILKLNDTLGSFKKVASDTKDLIDFGNMQGTLKGVPVLNSLSPQRLVTTLHWIDKNIKKVNNTWMKDLGQAFKGMGIKGPLSVAAGVRSHQDLQNEINEVNSFVANPEHAATKLDDFYSPMNLAAPETTQALRDRSLAAIGFLAEKAPKNLQQQFIGAGDEEWKPSDTEMAKYRRYSDAVHNPMILVKEIASGQINPETVEAVKQVYPNFFEKTAQGAMQYIAEKKVKLPYSKRLELANLFGVKTDASLNPANIASLQSNFTQPTQMGRPKTQQIQQLSQSTISAGDKLQK